MVDPRVLVRYFDGDKAMSYHIGVFCGGRWCNCYDANEKVVLICFLISPCSPVLLPQMSLGTEEPVDVSEGLVHGNQDSPTTTFSNSSGDQTVYEAVVRLVTRLLQQSLDKLDLRAASCTNAFAGPGQVRIPTSHVRRPLDALAATSGDTLL